MLTVGKTGLLLSMLTIPVMGGVLEVTLEKKATKEIAVSRANPVYLTPFTDNRQDHNLGYTVTTFGGKARDAVAMNDVPLFVNQVVESRLSARGYSVQKEYSDSTPALQVSGRIDRIFAKAGTSYSGDVALSVVVSSEGQQLLRKQFVGNAKGTINGALSAGVFNQIINKALNKALDTAFQALDGIDKNKEALLNGESVQGAVIENLSPEVNAALYKPSIPTNANPNQRGTGQRVVGVLLILTGALSLAIAEPMGNSNPNGEDLSGLYIAEGAIRSIIGVAFLSSGIVRYGQWNKWEKENNRKVGFHNRQPEVGLNFTFNY
jgi:uncharacterized lipoprotein YajG